MFPLLFDLRFDTPGSQAALTVAALGFAALIALAAAHETRDLAQRPRRAAAWGLGALLVGAALARVLAQRGLHVYSYGALIGLGLLASCVVAARVAWQTGHARPEHAVEAVFAALLGGLLGARLLDAIIDWPRYAAHPALLLAPGAGYVFHGGVLGGAVAWAAYARLRGIPVPVMADLAALPMALGHAFGRLGCLGAGCCWGALAGPGHAWALRFPGPLAAAYQAQLGDHRLVDATTHELLATAAARENGGALEIAAVVAREGRTLPLYPVQLLECLGELALFGLLWRLGRRRLRPGQLAATWLLGYAVLRLFTEALRGDEERGHLLGALPAWYNLSTGSLISLVLLVVGLLLLRRAGHAPA